MRLCFSSVFYISVTLHISNIISYCNIYIMQRQVKTELIKEELAFIIMIWNGNRRIPLMHYRSIPMSFALQHISFKIKWFFWFDSHILRHAIFRKYATTHSLYRNIQLPVFENLMRSWLCDLSATAWFVCSFNFNWYSNMLSNYF